MKVVSRSRRVSGTVALSLLVCLAALGASGCKNEDPPPPLPEPKPAATPTTLQLEAPEEDAGKEEEEPKKVGKGVKRASGPLAACCSALRQNAANAPPETKGHMLNAAAACDAANAAGGGKSGFLGALSGLLGGAGIPAACK